MGELPGGRGSACRGGSSRRSERTRCSPNRLLDRSPGLPSGNPLSPIRVRPAAARRCGRRGPAVLRRPRARRAWDRPAAWDGPGWRLLREWRQGSRLRRLQGLTDPTSTDTLGSGTVSIVTLGRRDPSPAEAEYRTPDSGGIASSDQIELGWIPARRKMVATARPGGGHSG